jgi:hypothetical protein
MILATIIRAAIVISIFVLPPMAGCRRPFSKDLVLHEIPWRAVAAALLDHPARVTARPNGDASLKQKGAPRGSAFFHNP